MSERVECRPNHHAPPAARLKPGGPAYKLNREREYWVDARLVDEYEYWVPVEPTPEPDESLNEPQGSVSVSESSEGEPNPTPPRSLDEPEVASQSVVEGVVCGAEKSNGEPCQRTVHDGEKCWQHKE